MKERREKLLLVDLLKPAIHLGAAAMAWILMCVVSMAAHEDEAVEVVEGAKVDGAAVAGQIAGQIVAAQRCDAGLREHCSGTASYAPDNLIT